MSTGVWPIFAALVALALVADRVRFYKPNRHSELLYILQILFIFAGGLAFVVLGEGARDAVWTVLIGVLIVVPEYSNPRSFRHQQDMRRHREYNETIRRLWWLSSAAGAILIVYGSSPLAPGADGSWFAYSHHWSVGLIYGTIAARLLTRRYGRLPAWMREAAEFR